MTPKQAYFKCKGKINKELEKDILTDPWCAYNYAKRIIKGRWIEAEPYIIKSSQITFWYAEDVIKGKLPENMHNAMIIHADTWAKLYFDFIKSL